MTNDPFGVFSGQRLSNISLIRYGASCLGQLGNFFKITDF